MIEKHHCKFVDMRRLPDFEGWAMFAKVVEDRSFAAAARELKVSVATVSRGVKRLEERLGGRLFNRNSRQLALTEFGERMAEKALQLLANAEHAESDARELASSPRGLIRLAVPMSFGVRRVAELLPEFLKQYPDISIDLHLSDATVDIVGDGFDAALRIALLKDSALVARELCTIKRYIVASPLYIKRYGQPHHPNDLKAHHCLGYAYRSQRETWHFLNHHGEEAAVQPHGPLRVTNADALIPMLLAGQGIAELPDFIANEYLHNKSLQIIMKNWHTSAGALYFVTPSARARPAKVVALSEFFAKKLTKPSWR